MSSSTIRLILADGRRILREGLCAILERQPGFRVVGQADEAGAAIKLLAAMEADVVVLVVTAATRDLTSLVRNIRQHGARIVLIFHTNTNPDGALIADMLRAGVLGCLAKDCNAEEFADAVSRVMRGDAYLSQQLSAAIVRNLSPSTRSNGVARLAPREREILRHLANGETTRQIAATLHITTKTVDTHRRRIMSKTRKRSLPELTKYAIREGLSSLETES